MEKSLNVINQASSDFPHPNTMRVALLAGNEQLYGPEYYSVGGGFIEWKGYKLPDKGQPKYHLDTCITAMSMTAKEMNPKYKETSEAGLAALVLC